MFKKHCYTSLIFVLCSTIGYASENMMKLNQGWLLQSGTLVHETGDIISTDTFQPEGWYPATVPTTVLNALVKNGVYPDPYVGMNNMRIPDASDTFNVKYDLLKYSHLPDKQNPWKDPYWFRTRFEIPGNFSRKNIWIHFNGINYRAEVWLNGSLIAGPKEMAGMFGDYTLNVTKYAFAGKTNTLAVKIYPLDEPGLPGAPQLETFGSFGLNGGDTGDIGKNVTMQCAIGWDWIPAVRDRDMGIWQDVFLSTTGIVNILHPRVITDLQLPDTSEAQLSISLELKNLSGRPQDVDVVAVLKPNNFYADSVILRRSVQLLSNQSQKIKFDPDTDSSLVLKTPALWWPNDMGQQNLYELKLYANIKGQLSDMGKTVFGIRKIDSKVTMVDGWARRDFFINGKKVLLKGGAWVPDMLLNRDEKHCCEELRFSKEAHLNLVRIWGGGVTPEEYFFNFCDRMGLLVWHDFWITGDCQGTWGKGSKDYPLEQDVFLRNATDVVLKLRNHPSLLVWTAGNEGYPREEIYSQLRNHILSEMDGTRPFLPSSGYEPPPESWSQSWPDNQAAGTYSGGPYCWVDPAVYYQKVNDGKDWVFKNEVGLPSLPVLESIQKFIPDLTPDPGLPYPLNQIWGYHDACEGNGKFSEYDQAIRQRYGEPKSLKDYVIKGQFINAENYRAIFESVNHAMDHVAGVLLWKINAAFPSVMWQLYDWYLCPNAGYYFTRKACEPLHIQLNLDDHQVSVINHLFQSFKRLSATAQIFSSDMKLLFAKTDLFDIQSNEIKNVIDLTEFNNENTHVYFVELLLTSELGELISENFYWMSAKRDFTSLASLPVAPLDIKAEKNIQDDNVLVNITLKNESDQLAHFIHLSICKEKEDGEVLPSYWSDNYFSMLPDRKNQISVTFPASEIETSRIYLKYEGWNVHTQWIEIDM